MFPLERCEPCGTGALACEGLARRAAVVSEQILTMGVLHTPGGDGRRML